MKECKRILIVEDEALVADHLALSLEKAGYEVVAIADNGEDTCILLDNEEIDLALLDINIIGSMDGVDLANYINTKHKIPFVFLTSNTDQKTVDRVTKTSPYGFIAKPFQEQDLKPIIDIAWHNWKDRGGQREKKKTEDAIYVKQNHRLIKIKHEDIHYFEAYDNYTKVFTASEKYLVSHTLKKTTENLPDQVL